MCIYICLCGALLFSLAQGENLTLPAKINLAKNDTVDTLDLPVKTNLSLVSEGGTLLTNMLPKQKLNSLITLDEELSKSKGKSVVPRKGVNNMLAYTSTDENNSSQSTNNNAGSILLERLNTTRSQPPVIVKSTDINVVTFDKLNSSYTTPKSNSTTVIHKKPLILSSEALASWDKQVQNNQPKMYTIPSKETMASSQIPSPNKGSIVKVYTTKSNGSHPGMIMPIVITILVVPMFAIVAYMALKRGQEAWKNRHYKRMDFLLDGMYND